VKWDKLFEEFMPRKIRRGREVYQVVRPESLEAKIQSEKVVGLISGTKETHNLILEFDKSDRTSVVKMLRDAADRIEGG